MAPSHPIEAEHLALLRQWASAQHRMDRLLAAQARSLAQAHGALIRLRAQLVIQHTQRLWGLGKPGFYLGTRPLRPCAAHPPQQPKQPQRQQTALVSAAMGVICQTGCQAHAHAWLGPQQECRLQGGPCVHMAANALGAPVPDGSGFVSGAD